MESPLGTTEGRRDHAHVASEPQTYPEHTPNGCTVLSAIILAKSVSL